MGVSGMSENADLQDGGSGAQARDTEDRAAEVPIHAAPKTNAGRAKQSFGRRWKYIISSEVENDEVRVISVRRVR
jgi:hypothetical protein